LKQEDNNNIEIILHFVSHIEENSFLPTRTYIYKQNNNIYYSNLKITQQYLEDLKSLGMKISKNIMDFVKESYIKKEVTIDFINELLNKKLIAENQYNYMKSYIRKEKIKRLFL